MSDTIDDGSAAGKCPVDFKTRSLWGLWGGGAAGAKPAGASIVEKQQPASLEEAARHAQTPHPTQRLPLSTHRLDSTIPRSSTNNRNASNAPTLPAHQIRVDRNRNHAPEAETEADGGGGNWVYPSEQQVFNAMKRKGWNNVEEESIPSFLQIHNSVNERSWNEILKWENSDDDIELSRFEGRPQNVTPKAWILSTLGIRDKPFDRHDWYVVRKNGGSSEDAPIEKRYVLDFYMTRENDGLGSGGMLPRVEIDVRPALDGPSAAVQRGTGLLRDLFPGIARECDDAFASRRQNQRSSPRK